MVTIDKERYSACMLCHTLGDTIGFRNGTWEFNYGGSCLDYSIQLRMLFDFIHDGGVNHLNIKKWIASDDTILHFAIAEALINSTDNESIYTTCIDNFIRAVDTDMTGRMPGGTTIASVTSLKKNEDWKKRKYSSSSGGCGAAMRTHCIGLAFHNDINKLIEVSIETSRITHNSVIGYLGGLVTALFTHYAINNVPIEDWAFRLVDLLETNTIDDYILSSFGIKEYRKEKDTFIFKWKDYIIDKFKPGTKILKQKQRNTIERVKYYYNAFRNTDKGDFIGSGGDDSVIIAYDCLLDSGPNWEKLIIYSMLHIGDSDTTGCIAGGWYGAYYGYRDVPKNMIKDAEKAGDAIKIGVQLHKKYTENEKKDPE